MELAFIVSALRFAKTVALLRARLWWHQGIRAIVGNQQTIMLSRMLDYADAASTDFENTASGKDFSVASASAIDFSPKRNYHSFVRIVLSDQAGPG